jgi:hypothetical protein
MILKRLNSNIEYFCKKNDKLKWPKLHITERLCFSAVGGSGPGRLGCVHTEEMRIKDR